MIFHSPQKQLSAAPCIFLDGNSIHPSDSTNFLGVVLDKNVKFDEHIKIAFQDRFRHSRTYKNPPFFPVAYITILILLVHS